MITAVNFAELPPKSSVADYLDVAVNRACLAYGVADVLAYQLDESGNLSNTRVEILNQQLLRLAYVSDGRFLAEADASEIERELGWVDIAVGGLKRMSKAVPELRYKQKSRLFAPTPAGEEMQKDIFTQMDEMRRQGAFGIAVVDLDDIPMQTAISQAAEHLSDPGRIVFN